jgi:hypothetical protein
MIHNNSREAPNAAIRRANGLRASAFGTAAKPAASAVAREVRA